MLLAEWLRIRSRRDLWLGAVAAAILAGLTYLSNASNATGGERFAFPESVVTLVRSTQLMIVAIAAYAAAAMVGAEFNYRTLRTSLLVNGDRVTFALIRIAAVAGYGAILVLLVTLVASALPFVAMVPGADQPANAAGGLGRGLAVTGSALLFATFAALLAAAATLLVRNTAIALLLSATYGVGEGLVIGLIERATRGEIPPLHLLPVASLQLLSERAVGAPSTIPISTGTVLVGVLLWIALMGVACTGIVRRMDVE
ncbi:MAG TPA: ABC transporter permease [candidate division Zixibacteria bacterium]|nr:ABC transporter permease [candidate division Zixibacteria bacterium]